MREWNNRQERTISYLCQRGVLKEIPFASIQTILEEMGEYEEQYHG